MAADETVFKLKGEEVVVGFVLDGVSGETLGFDVLFKGNRWLSGDSWKPVNQSDVGSEVLVSDGNGSYSVAAAELGLSQQLCIAHVRKYVTKRSNSILEQAEKEWDERDEKLGKLKEDLRELKELLRGLPEEGGKRIGRLHGGYLWAAPPTRKGQQTKGATAAYRMRLLTLKLWNEWNKIRLYLARPELELDGTNNASERSIGKSKVRYKSMRGYKSMGGMKNGDRPNPMALQRGRTNTTSLRRWQREPLDAPAKTYISKFAHRLWDSYDRLRKT